MTSSRTSDPLPHADLLSHLRHLERPPSRGTVLGVSTPPALSSSAATTATAATRATVAALTAAAALAAVLAAPAPVPAQETRPTATNRAGPVEALSAMEARSIGPAGMSGRVSDVEVVPGRENVIYVGSATGGVWKSRDAGHTWEPIMDDQPVSSIGAVAVHPENPDLVWVGTGEPNVRNSSGLGRGVWKSADGGESWEFAGLEDSEHIARILVHPDDPDVAYVAALGPLWNDGGQRGVYRTTDGGESWAPVLEGPNERTGAADLVMDPENPDKLIASLWQFRRWPHFFESGGPGSGLFITHDGGDTWRELGPEDGLPEGELGRAGLAVFEGDPSVVYALVEAERNALVRSDDGGRSWHTVNDDPGVNPRPFYYADIRVDPRNENRIYRLAGRISVSEDGGRSFRTVVPSRIVHGDVHELRIDPDDPRKLILGSDGGVFFSNDRGESWRFAENLPLAQFYELTVDRAVPYHVYGGMQDNGSWFGPTEVWREKGIMNPYFMRVGGGDGFHVSVDPGDPDFGYGESQRGFLYRFHKETGSSTGIRPAAPAGADELRFNWNAPVAHDPFDDEALYFGSQYVHHTADRGETWRRVSPDLTTDSAAWQRQDRSGGLTKDVTGAENYTTVYTIAPSPVEEGVVWAGTDDGNVHVTRDGGETWTNVQANMPGKPRHGWVSHVHASAHDAGTAFVAVHDYMRGDWTNYVYRTRDYGGTWTRLSAEGVDGFARTVLQDPAEPSLLYQGTEFGLFVSVDGGQSWTKWTHGIPTVPVRALAVQRDEHDLAVGTHGRGAFVVDDVRPLRALARDPDLREEPLHLFPPSRTVQHAEGETRGYRSTGHTMFRGDDPPYGALFSYWIGAEGSWGEEGDGVVPDSVVLRILGAGGDTLRTLTGPGVTGFSRVAWDLETEPIGLEDTDARFPGPQVPPGRYAVELAAGGASVRGTVHVELDPALPYGADDRRARYDAVRSLEPVLVAAGRVEQRLEAVREGLDRVVEVAGRDAERAGAADIADDARALRSAADSLWHRLVEPRPCQGICADSTALGEMQDALFPLTFGLDAPTAAQRSGLERARARLEDALGELNTFLGARVAPFQERLREADLPLMPELEPLPEP